MKLLTLASCLLLLVYCSAEETAKNTENPETKQNDNSKAELSATPLKPEEPATDGNVPSEIKQFFERQQFAPEIYGLTYVQPQGGQPSLDRLQPQLVLYGPGGQGQPILINPGNPPGNFLIPQGPGPNVLVRNPAPQGPGFPVASYPKPAHVPPIEKDAEEVPTNPAKVPPFTAEKPKSKPKAKPEKLETFTEQNVPEQSTKPAQGESPRIIPETVSLRPGQRFFFLNGDNLFPIEEQPQIQNDFTGLRYTQVQQSLYPQSKFLQPFAQEPPQFVQDIDEGNVPISVPSLLLRNSFVNAQQKPNQPQQEEEKNDGILRTAQQYFRTGPVPDSLYTPLILPYLEQQEGITGFLGQPTQGPSFKSAASNEIVQPQLFGQFRFTPNGLPEAYQFRDDIDNEAIVVDATFDAGVNSDPADTNLKADQSEAQESSEETKQESEATMAQAGPQATAIAGPGGVAGSAPRATAIVGKGGLAVSSPQATAVAGTTDEDKKSKPTKKETS